MTNGEKMRQQVLNALENSKYKHKDYEYKYVYTAGMEQHDKLIDGLKVLVKGLPSVDRRKKCNLELY